MRSRCLLWRRAGGGVVEALARRRCLLSLAVSNNISTGFQEELAKPHSGSPEDEPELAGVLLPPSYGRFMVILVKLAPAS